VAVLVVDMDQLMVLLVQLILAEAEVDLVDQVLLVQLVGLELL
jgi:hypothetical protein